MPSERISNATIAPDAVRLRAVPEAGDDGAHQRREVRAPYAGTVPAPAREATPVRTPAMPTMFISA